MTIKIAILGYYGFGNAGDEAVLDGMLSSLRTASLDSKRDIDVTVLSANPEETKARCRVDAVRRTSVKNVLMTLVKTDVFILGGGSLLQDVTGRGLSVLYYAGMTLLSAVLGKKIIFYAQGIGPIKKSFNRFLARMAASAAGLISVRDNGSMLELRLLGIKSREIYLTADPAFAIVPSKDIVLRSRLIEFLPKKPIIGVMLRDWKGMSDKLQDIASAVGAFAKKKGANIVLVPMQKDGDLKICRTLSRLLKEECTVLDADISPEVMSGLFKEFDIVVAMRLHALIFAAMAGVPIAGLGYDPKVYSFLAQVGIQKVYSPESFDTLDFEEYLEELWSRKESVGEQLLSKTAELRCLALEFAERAIAYIAGGKKK